MTECHLIGAYASETQFIKELNNLVKCFDYSNIEIQYKMVLNETEVLYSALVVIKECK